MLGLKEAGDHYLRRINELGVENTVGGSIGDDLKIVDELSSDVGVESIESRQQPVGLGTGTLALNR